MSQNDWIVLNVGGKFFETTLTTLMNIPYFQTANKFAPLQGTKDHPLRIDRDGQVFKHVLRYIRNPLYNVPLDQQWDLDFWFMGENPFANDESMNQSDESMFDPFDQDKSFNEDIQINNNWGRFGFDNAEKCIECHSNLIQLVDYRSMKNVSLDPKGKSVEFCVACSNLNQVIKGYYQLWINCGDNDAKQIIKNLKIFVAFDSIMIQNYHLNKHFNDPKYNQFGKYLCISLPGLPYVYDSHQISIMISAIEFDAKFDSIHLSWVKYIYHPSTRLAEISLIPPSTRHKQIYTYFCHSRSDEEGLVKFEHFWRVHYVTKMCWKSKSKNCVKFIKLVQDSDHLLITQLDFGLDQSISPKFNEFVFKDQPSFGESFLNHGSKFSYKSSHLIKFELNRKEKIDCWLVCERFID